MDLSGSPHQTRCWSLLTLKAFNVNQFTRHLDCAVISQRCGAFAPKPGQMDSPRHGIRGKQRGSVSSDCLLNTSLRSDLTVVEERKRQPLPGDAFFLFAL